MSELSFRFAEPSPPVELVKALSSRLHPPELFGGDPRRLLSHPFEWPEAVDAAALSAVLGRLVPSDMCLLLVGPAGAPAAAEQLAEPWYGTSYALERINGATLGGWAGAAPHPRLSLPPPNPYVPDDEGLRMLAPPTGSLAQPARAPERLTSATDEDAAGRRVWHLDTGPFDRPRASILWLLRTPLVADSTARSAVLTELACQLLGDALTTPLAACGPAGLGWSVSANAGGLLVQAGGYSQRLPRLSLDLAAALARFSPDAGRFEVLREVIARSLRNRAQERPLWHAQYELASALTTHRGAPSMHYP